MNSTTKRKRSREEVTSFSNGNFPRGIHDDFFLWMLGTTQHGFFKNYFEKKPLHFSHGSALHFTNPPSGICPVKWSTEIMLQLASEKSLFYTKDVNIVRFDKTQGKRISYQDNGEIKVEDMQRCMKEDWSIRFLRPHEYILENSIFISKLEEIFNCFCGINSYWTPPGSQGFAPHYDDVDVFLLQLEGEKVWRLYNPPEDVDILSRYSSEDYSPKDLPKPIMTLHLTPGDILYMPRGTVHQGCTLEHTHSLHVTFSANQMNTWTDLIKHSLTHAVEKLSANNINWRKSLPRSLLKSIGSIYNPIFRSENNLPILTEKQKKSRFILQSKFREMMAELSLYISNEEIIDECCDMYACDTVAKLQPPQLTSVLNKKYNKDNNKSNKKTNNTISSDSIIRLVSPNCARLILASAADGEVHVYHSGGNSTVCLENPVGVLRFEAEFAPAIASIIIAPPEGIIVSKLPFPAFVDDDDIIANQLILVETFYENGIIILIK